ncbi:integron-associated effector binding protein [Gelidibacter algens]|uniref:Integron-associated effector binding protein n=1 Tax=Gelidibacter algens TaxID=49280 RepID=A0A327RUF7_9FLAO|nr:integron-associated effector binding protein [Gelidibacter algens]
MQVNSLVPVPNGFVGRKFKNGNYQKFVAKGELQHAVVGIWQEVWKKDKELNRKYTADFEIYKKDVSTVDVYIAIK